MPGRPYPNCDAPPPSAQARKRRWVALLAAVAVAVLALPRAWPAGRIGNAAGAPLAVLPMPFEQPGHSFPGSAFFYLSGSSPAAPELTPAPATRWERPVAPGAAAQRLYGAGTASDRARALTCLTQAVYYEAAGEPLSGQRAVAQVVLNRVAHPHYPKTVCGVVFQGAERTTGCQFTFTCDGAMNRRLAQLLWLQAQAVARAALGGYVHAPVGLATHYHSTAVHPDWADALRPAAAIGAHRFYRLGGAAGTPAAFRPAWYVGNEPVPSPPREVAQTAALTDPHGTAANAVAGGEGPAAAQWSPPQFAVQLPAGGEIRAEFANSGKWLDRPR